MILELDGCELPVGEFYQNSAGKSKRRVFWKDTRCGLVRHLDEVDKRYTCAIEPDEAVVEKMRALSHKKGMTERTEIVAVADGGQGLKEALEAQFHPLQLILDRPHLKSHFYETAEALGKSPETAKAWVERHLDRIHQGEALTVIKNLKRQQTLSPHDRRKRLIAYLERFQDCIHSDEFRKNKWPIGSGEVESAHRILPQKRMKLAGAWWKEKHINPMLALRTVRINGWWNEMWLRSIDRNVA